VTDKLVKLATITAATGAENRNATAKVVGPRNARPEERCPEYCRRK